MVIPENDEMKRLKTIFKPYEDKGCVLKNDAPDEVVKAYEEYHRLSKKQYYDEVATYFD